MVNLLVLLLMSYHLRAIVDKYVEDEAMSLEPLVSHICLISDPYVVN